MRYNGVIDIVSKELGLSKEVVENTYKAYWEYIKYTIEQLPFKEELSQKDFEALRTSINIPSLGKLNCTYNRYVGMKNRFKIINKIRSKQ